VARLGSVTLAAKELHVTHSAISQQIKVLEEMVGLKLFIRHGRGVQINEEGRLYALQVREALHHIADATRLVQVNPRRQELTLAMVPLVRLPLVVAAPGTVSGEISPYLAANTGEPGDHQHAAGRGGFGDTHGKRRLGRNGEPLPFLR
jgi:DNA-binding transcriptional LysR family regulator